MIFHHICWRKLAILKKEEIKINPILICANILKVDIPAQSFDFIYSIGVLENIRHLICIPVTDCSIGLSLVESYSLLLWKFLQCCNRRVLEDE